MTEDNRPTGLTVIEGGKARPKTKQRSGNKATPGGLTEKQARFAEGLAAGMTNAEAYRAAYGAENMKPGTVWSEACKQAQHPKVSARVDEILAQRKAQNGMLSEKQGDRVWRNVWRLAEGENVPPSVQQAALALAAKMAGMLTDQVKIENTTTDSKSIEAEIMQRLQKLAG